VNTGMTVATLLDVHSYSVDVDLPVAYFIQKENFVGYSCQQPQVSDSLFPLQLSGYQAKADNNQLYTMTFRLDPKDNKKLVPGMNVLVKISYKNGIVNQLSVPLQAVFNQDSKSYVWVFDPETSTVQRREVTTDGLVGDGEIRIVSGLSGADSIVVAGVNSLHENEKVRLLEAASETNIGGLL
jgi:membrane fusion protein, multidrug efflux system